MIFMSPRSCIVLDEPSTSTYDLVDRPDIKFLVDEAKPVDLLTPRAVAAMLFVDRKTVFRWARSGKLTSIRTPGGQRRYLKADVLAIMSGACSDHKDQSAPLSAPPDGDRGEARRAPGTSEAQATAVVAEAVAIALEAEATVTAEAVVQIAAAVAAAAEKAAEAVERARSARAHAAEKAAQTLAREGGPNPCPGSSPDREQGPRTS